MRSLDLPCLGPEARESAPTWVLPTLYVSARH